MGGVYWPVDMPVISPDARNVCPECGLSRVKRVAYARPHTRTAEQVRRCERVRSLRADNGWSQSKLAAALTAIGVPSTRVDVSAIELGQARAMTPRSQARAAAAILILENNGGFNGRDHG